VRKEISNDIDKLMKVQNRINDPTDIDLDFIDKELKANKHVIVQFSDKTYTDKQLSILDGLCEKYNTDFGVRFYGHYSCSFDFKTVLKLPNVKCLYTDCLLKADNITAIGELDKLDKLSLGVFELKETEILNTENLKHVSELIITETRTKALNLDYLGDYKKLKFLIIGEHKKNIEAIGEISDLEFLSLNSIKNTPIGFVNRLNKLRTLRFILGGRENIQEIEENEIENLELVWIRGFNDLGNISMFKKLKTLLIEDNIQLPKIHFDQELKELKDLKILNCKTLQSVTGLNRLTALEQLRIYKTAIEFDTFIKDEFPNSLKTFAFYTSKKKVDDIIRKTLDKRGYKEWSK
jgi:protein phosphatase 1 regulatory subunit 7